MFFNTERFIIAAVLLVCALGSNLIACTINGDPIADNWCIENETLIALGDTLNFDGSDSFDDDNQNGVADDDPDEKAQIEEWEWYLWDWLLLSDSMVGSGATFSYDFDDAGCFDMDLYVKGDDGVDDWSSYSSWPVWVIGVRDVIATGSTEDPVYIAAGQSIELNARRDPVRSFFWPVGWPTWEHSGGELIPYAYPTGTASFTADDPGEYTVTATCGDSEEDITVKVFDVELEKQDSGNTPDLSKGAICLNAQSCYKKAKWKANIFGGGTAKVTLGTGAFVTFLGINGSDPYSLADGEEFWVVGGNNTGVLGTYQIILTHNMVNSCVDTDTGDIFKFVSVLNSNSLPTVRQSSANTYTNTTAGSNHDGGCAQVSWGLVDTDSSYVSEGIGDTAVDVQPNIGGESRNKYQSSNGTNNVEFWAGAQDIGIFQTTTYPSYDLNTGRLRVTADLAMTATGTTQGYSAITGSVSLGVGVLGIIKFKVGTSVTLPGKFACGGGIGLLWNGAAITSSNDDYWDSWKSWLPDVSMKSGSHNLNISASVSAEESLEDELPFGVSIGFAGGVTLKEDEPNPNCYGFSKVSGPVLGINNIQYSIIE